VIYFIRAAGTDMVKIGYSRDEASMTRRLKALQTAQPWQLEVVRTIEANQWAEGWLHGVFKEDHHRGEWFTWNPEMMGVTPPPGPVVWQPLLSEKKRADLEALIEWLVDLLDHCTIDPDAEPDGDFEDSEEDADQGADLEPEADDEAEQTEDAAQPTACLSAT
jgi:hypothetical protein